MSLSLWAAVLIHQVLCPCRPTAIRRTCFQTGNRWLARLSKNSNTGSRYYASNCWDTLIISGHSANNKIIVTELLIYWLQLITTDEYILILYRPPRVTSPADVIDYIKRQHCWEWRCWRTNSSPCGHNNWASTDSGNCWPTRRLQVD